MISKLKKLRGRSLAELADRSRQGVGALLDRAGLSRHGRVISEDELFAIFGAKSATAEDLLDRFRNRAVFSFFPSFENREQTLAVLSKRFPEEGARLAESADRIVSGRFDLLGFRDLDLGSPVPDWHYEPISGKRSPLKHWSKMDESDSTESGDKKIVWELNRHQYFTTLGAAYWITGKEDYAEAFAAHVSDWIEKNPAKLGVNWSSSLEISFRSMSWLWGIAFFIGSPAVSADLFCSMLRCLISSGRHIERHLSTYTSPNTHLTGEALGLVLLGSFLPELREARRWKRKGLLILQAQLELQVRNDGGYVEQATHYQRYTADFYLALAVLLKAEGASLDEELFERLRKMLDLLAHMAHPDGTTPMIGDEDGGRLHFLDGRPLNDLRSTLAVGAVVLEDENLKFAAGEPTPELLWVTGPAGMAKFDELQPRPPIVNSNAFRESGIYIMRNGWDKHAAHLLIDCGEHGFLNGAHAHADALGMILYTSGSPIFVDSGTGSYTGDAAVRDRFRSTPAHNCLSVNGESSSIPCGPFSWQSNARSEVILWNYDDKKVTFRGRHDGFDRFNVSYERQACLESDGKFTLTDVIESGSRNIFDLNFILDPRVNAKIVGPMKVDLTAADGNRRLLLIETLFHGDAECPGWCIDEATVSPRYGSFAGTTRLRFRFAGEGKFTITSSMLPE